MRPVSATRQLIVAAVFLTAIAWSNAAFAQLTVGTWIRTDGKGKGITMTVEKCCNGGERLVWHIPAMGNQPPTTMTVESPMDGTDVPALVDGKPSGETMALKRIDDHHYSSVIKMDGKPFGTGKSTISPDGKTITVESVMGSPGSQPTPMIETWVKK